MDQALKYKREQIKKTKPTLEEIYDRFYYCLYGCNQQVRKLLDRHVRFRPVYFFEYLIFLYVYITVLHMPRYWQ